MPNEVHKSEGISLWECLHDGSIASIDSDFMARTLTIVIDSPYHWEFHKLSPDTRFTIVGDNVRIAEAFNFEPWLGAIEPTRETPWEEAQARRQSDYEMGLLVSTDWSAFVRDVKTDEDYEVMNAELGNGPQFAILELGIMSYPNSNYRTVRVHAEHFRFRVGERGLSLEEFQEFGAAYWNNFAQKSTAQSVETESA